MVVGDAPTETWLAPLRRHGFGVGGLRLRSPGGYRLRCAQACVSRRHCERRQGPLGGNTYPFSTGASLDCVPIERWGRRRADCRFRFRRGSRGHGDRRISRGGRGIHADRGRTLAGGPRRLRARRARQRHRGRDVVLRCRAGRGRAGRAGRDDWRRSKIGSQRKWLACSKRGSLTRWLHGRWRVRRCGQRSRLLRGFRSRRSAERRRWGEALERGVHPRACRLATLQRRVRL
jgi:hypothetical protein